MWYLTKKYPILQEILPYPTSGIQTGFGCPVCPHEENHPLVYTNLHRSNNPNLIGLRCSTFKDGTHFFQTPYLSDVIQEIHRHNQDAYNKISQLNLINSKGKDIAKPQPEIDVKGLVKCKGVDDLYAIGHREHCLRRCPNQLCQQCCRQRAAKVCSHHRDRETEVIDLSIPRNSASSLAPSNPTLPSASKYTQSDRILAPLPIRPTVDRPTQRAQADKSFTKDLSRDSLAQSRPTQNKKDRKTTKDLTLRVWLKAGEAVSIGAQATDFPRFALIECKPLRNAALTQLKEQWDTKLEIFQADSMEWILSDASLGYKYNLSTDTILIKAIGLRHSKCIGLAEEMQKMIRCGIHKSKLTNQNQIISSHESQKSINKQSWPGNSSRLSDLILWCTKAPKDCPKGVIKTTWLEIFGNKFNPDQHFKTPYKYRTWALNKEMDLIKWMKSRKEATIQEAVHAFKDSFRQISLQNGTLTHPVILE
ncbi:hypothetical protein DFH28DRAFT_929988 [Melampsora americana]|nr:hypothetical protein DFH28DRAFT_929988 [Melampsora americana]